MVLAFVFNEAKLVQQNAIRNIFPMKCRKQRIKGTKQGMKIKLNAYF
jgi:hypothetical protein